MRVSAKGQVTIPVSIREQAGLLPDTEVSFAYRDGVVHMSRAPQIRKQSRGAKLVAAMRGKGDVVMTTDEIMALTRDVM